MEAFRFKYLSAKIDYKAIQFKTDENRTYTVSDFETANLRQLEKFCLVNFELKGVNFKKLNEKEKSFEIELSRQFDISQAKDIKFALVFLICLCCFILFMLIKQGLEDISGTISVTRGFFILTISVIIIGLIRQIAKNGGSQKNGA